MSFWGNARRAAAHEFGRRHYRGILGFEIAKRLVPALALGAVAAGIVWGLAKGWQWSTHATTHIHLSFGWAHTLAPIAVTLLIVAAVVGLVVAAARRWMWLIDGFLPLEHTSLWVGGVVVAFVVGAGGITWAVL